MLVLSIEYNVVVNKTSLARRIENDSMNRIVLSFSIIKIIWNQMVQIKTTFKIKIKITIKQLVQALAEKSVHTQWDDVWT